MIRSGKTHKYRSNCFLTQATIRRKPAGNWYQFLLKLLAPVVASRANSNICHSQWPHVAIIQLVCNSFLSITCSPNYWHEIYLLATFFINLRKKINSVVLDNLVCPCFSFKLLHVHPILIFGPVFIGFITLNDEFNKRHPVHFPLTRRFSWKRDD